MNVDYLHFLQDWAKKTKQFMILDVYILVFDILQAC